MAAVWATEEVGRAELGDARLNARLDEVLTQLGNRPAASIPLAAGGHAEMTAAYRFCQNPKVTFEAIVEPHRERTRTRIAAQNTVFLVQDTSEMDLTRPTQQVKGVGPLDGGARLGAFLHLLHAFTEDGTPLGTVDATLWTRQQQQERPRPSRAKRAATPIEEKESVRWLDTLRVAQEEADRCPGVRMICLSDSEADIYEVLAQGQAEQSALQWIVRTCQNRAVLPETDDSDLRSIREHLEAQPALLCSTVEVRGREPKVACETRGRRQARQSRQAHLHVRAARVTLRPPWRSDRRLPAIDVNVVLAREEDPPEGDEPIEWLLCTNLPVDTAEQAQDVIRFYCVRWMIEIFFRVLKSGCRVEKRRFEHFDRWQTGLAIFMIVAWRTLYTCRLGRKSPELDCDVIFEPAEWKAVWAVVQHCAPPSQPPPLGTFVPMVAKLGGFVKRKGAYPGPETIWIGLQRARDFALCWESFGPG